MDAEKQRTLKDLSDNIDLAQQAVDAAQVAYIREAFGGPVRRMRPWGPLAHAERRQLVRLPKHGGTPGAVAAHFQLLTTWPYRASNADSFQQPARALLRLSTTPYTARSELREIELSTGWVAGETIVDAVRAAEDKAIAAGWYCRTGEVRDA